MSRMTDERLDFALAIARDVVADLLGRPYDADLLDVARALARQAWRPHFGTAPTAEDLDAFAPMLAGALRYVTKHDAVLPVAR